MVTTAMTKTSKCCGEDMHEWRTEKRKGNTKYQKCLFCKSVRIQKHSQGSGVPSNFLSELEYLDIEGKETQQKKHKRKKR